MPLFEHQPTIVEARRLTQQIDCYTRRDGVAIPAFPGDWIITNRETGEVYRVEHKDFLRLYKPKDDEATDYLMDAKSWEFED